MMREKVLFFCALLANWALVIGIKLDSVVIPQYGMQGSSVTLGCFFDLEKDTFLVLKWYKGTHEFFRYSIQNSPSILTFPVEGINVEIMQSSMNQVVLKNLSLSTSDSFKCEVTSDFPSFRTLYQQADLIVIAPPKDLPLMECTPTSINPGDILNCNCSSFSSKPAASLMYYLNDNKANFGDMIEYLPLPEPSGLETSILGLAFQVEPLHLRNGTLQIKCTATIGNGYWVTTVNLTEAAVAVAASIPGHNRLLSGGCRGNGSGGLLLTLLTLSGLLLLLRRSSLC